MTSKKEIGKLRGIGKIHYPSRIVGMSLACAVIVTSQYYVGELYSAVSFIYIGIALFYPHLVLYIYWKSDSNKNVENRMLLVDSVIAGSAAPVLAFNLLPTVILLTFSIAGTMVAKGFRYFLKGLLAIIIGAFLAYALLKFDVEVKYHLEFGMILVLSIFILIYMLLFAYASNLSIVQVIKNRRVIRSQKDEIDQQRLLIKRKNDDILDSITYAKRIQEAILPPDRIVHKWLPDSFVLYKPKDIVAGDFYWLESIEDTIIFAAADCTGHGVPGAMVSVVCHNALNRAVREFGLREPGEILDKVNDLVEDTFVRSDEEVKDGMDLALCSLSDNILKYSGAHNPLWIIRKVILSALGGSESAEPEYELIITKADKLPIGSFNEHQPYTTYTFELSKGDTVYIFSDGYIDQFGGSRGKKYKAKAFRDLLLSIQDKSMDDQRTFINKTFEEWKGDLEQLDDICIIGYRHS
ncbi:SpoIIE family protein phosphatase [Crocinitomix catalasitica]|nr:SpoIIE family protein phosphatase [Crocinitomix catalasitica]